MLFPPPRASKILPRHIYEEPHRYTVRIVRGHRKYSASILKTTPSPLAAAIAARDRLAAQAGPSTFPTHHARPTKPRSNTGFVGISETIKWVLYRPRYAFRVFLGERPKSKFIYYGRARTRSQALKIAINLRKSLPTHGAKNN